MSHKQGYLTPTTFEVALCIDIDPKRELLRDKNAYSNLAIFWS
jgi:hypothetical protein